MPEVVPERNACDDCDAVEILWKSVRSALGEWEISGVPLGGNRKYGMVFSHHTSFSLLNPPIDIVSLARSTTTAPDPYLNCVRRSNGTYVELLDGSNCAPFEHKKQLCPRTHVSL